MDMVLKVMIADQFKHITLQQLEALVALVEERSFSDAARKMMLSQPSLSKHIRNLEIFVNSPLINRTKTGISLTSEGTILFAYAKKILKLRDEARDKIVSLGDTLSGHVYIGTSTIPSTYILPPLLTGLKKDHPDIRIHILSGDSDDILEMVLSSQVEIGFIGKHTHDSRIVSEPIWQDELIPVASKGNPIADLRKVTFGDIIREPFILREKGSGTRAILEDYLKTQGHEPLSRFTIACELGSSEAVKEAVISGLGISILSIHAVKREISQGLLTRIPLEGPRILRSFFMITRRQFSPMQHHRVFIEYAKAYPLEP